MNALRLLRSKLHRFQVTEANLEYVGSIAIDRQLMDAAGILPLEEVHLINLRNGERWSTYAIPEAPGTGTICVNGGGALKCRAGDLLIIYTMATREADDVRLHGHQARVILSDGHNRPGELRIQTLSADGAFETVTTKP